jgi:hypothetical protein
MQFGVVKAKKLKVRSESRLVGDSACPLVNEPISPLNG